MFNVSIHIKDNKILGSLVVDSYFFEPSKYSYAFYLYKDNEKVDVALYSSAMDVSFNLKDMTGIFYIKAYIMDIEHGDKRTFDSEKISIDS
ncbi:hypothetical protein ACTXMK_06440 [Psychrobacter celer]|uniref:hypothetical protein n=1 Tax=Psychrobacter celer TaxID=306572 RepID=UPI003FD5BA54|tara:strand:+ start:11210 stop:11482 length:273 start_codon:yes stop_codon:yes gene_type:complete